MPFKHLGRSKDVSGNAEERMQKALEMDPNAKLETGEKAGPFTKEQQKDYTDRRGEKTS